MLNEGDPAPDFELLDDAGERVRLADFRGRSVVLYFYPEADTPGCTVEACGFRDAFKEFEGRGAVVLGVSPDEAAPLVKFRQKHNLPFRLLSDPDHAIASAYGAWGPKKLFGHEYEGILRSTFVIDAAGRIARVFRKVKVEGHWEEVLAALPATK